MWESIDVGGMMTVIRWIIVAALLFLAIWFLSKARENMNVVAVSNSSTSTVVTQTVPADK